MTALNREMTFDTDPTQSATTAAEAFALRRGVCQDLTHIFIAAARQLGIPARYVGGHFYRADGVTAQEAGHAWAEAYVEHLGWVGFDPTNGIGTTDAHVRVAIGLDYLGAAPVRGTRYRRRRRNPQSGGARRSGAPAGAELTWRMTLPENRYRPRIDCPSGFGSCAMTLPDKGPRRYNPAAGPRKSGSHRRKRRTT